jgi:type IV fimbrial biogenesis protein FimT
VLTGRTNLGPDTSCRAATARQAGFTLIELLVVIVIMGILLATGAPSFRDWIQNTQIRNAAEAIFNGLQLAKAEAVRLNAPVQFVLGTGSSWSVGCATPVATDANNDGMADCPAVLQSRSGSEGSSNAAVVATQSTIAFDGLGRVTPVPAGDLTFTVTNPVGGTCVAVAGNMRCLNVVVSMGGLIRMCDPAFSRTANPNPGGLPVGPQGC